MALHNLKITVIDGGKASDVGAFGVNDNSGGSEGRQQQKSILYKVLNYNQTIRDYVKQSVSPTTFFAIQQGASLAMQTGREFINYYVSDIGRTNGDSNYQSIVNRKIEIATDVLSFGQGALSGAAMGSVVPVIGSIIGAVVGAAASGINLAFKYAERERTYQHEMFKENTSQAYQLSRANYSALTGRVR